MMWAQLLMFSCFGRRDIQPRFPETRRIEPNTQSTDLTSNSRKLVLTSPSSISSASNLESQPVESSAPSIGSTDSLHQHCLTPPISTHEGIDVENIEPNKHSIQLIDRARHNDLTPPSSIHEDLPVSTLEDSPEPTFPSSWVELKGTRVVYDVNDWFSRPSPRVPQIQDSTSLKCNTAPFTFNIRYNNNAKRFIKGWDKLTIIDDRVLQLKLNPLKIAASVPSDHGYIVACDEMSTEQIQSYALGGMLVIVIPMTTELPGMIFGQENCFVAENLGDLSSGFAMAWLLGRLVKRFINCNI